MAGTAGRRMQDLERESTNVVGERDMLMQQLPVEKNRYKSLHLRFIQLTYNMRQRSSGPTL
eukprot:5787425-Amphidinium_carterae.2